MHALADCVMEVPDFVPAARSIPEGYLVPFFLSAQEPFWVSLRRIVETRLSWQKEAQKNRHVYVVYPPHLQIACKLTAIQTRVHGCNNQGLLALHCVEW